MEIMVNGRGDGFTNIFVFVFYSVSLVESGVNLAISSPSSGAGLK